MKRAIGDRSGRPGAAEPYLLEACGRGGRDDPPSVVREATGGSVFSFEV
jgi:hypothetical protein